jgi:hypothetical protein
VEKQSNESRFRFFLNAIVNGAALFARNNAGHLQASRSCHTAITVADLPDSNAEMNLRIRVEPRRLSENGS